MNQNLIFIPVLVQVLLALILYIVLSVAKTRAVKRNQVNNDRRALHDDAWPDSVLQINNCIRNQFEVPVLFYVLSFILWALNTVSIVALSLAVAFVLTRYIHAYIHTSNNHVPTRRRVFMLGCLLIIVMMVLAGMSLITTSS